MARTDREKHGSGRKAVKVRQTPKAPRQPTCADATAPETPNVLTKPDVAADLASPIRARWYAVQRVVYQLLEEGKVPTQTAIAEKLGVRRQTIWCFFRDNPGFLPWLTDAMGRENEQLIVPLARRHWQIGMQGSVQSADFFMKVVSGYYLSPLHSVVGADEANNASGGTASTIINLLCPRPEIYAKAFNEVPTGLPHAGPMRTAAALPPVSASVEGQKMYGASLPATIPVVPAKVPQ